MLHVSQHGLTSEKAVKCGERDDTLPPGYRFSDMVSSLQLPPLHHSFCLSKRLCYNTSRVFSVPLRIHEKHFSCGLSLKLNFLMYVFLYVFLYVLYYQPQYVLSIDQKTVTHEKLASKTWLDL